jgi:hypothetical protein
LTTKSGAGFGLAPTPVATKASRTGFVSAEQPASPSAITATAMTGRSTARLVIDLERIAQALDIQSLELRRKWRLKR